VLRLDDSRGLAVALKGPAPGERDPFAAGHSAVTRAAQAVSDAGGTPLALTDCLNFGNPEKPEIGWELAQAIEGIARAAEELGIPIVSGNVSLYNETGGAPIPPTPVVGCVDWCSAPPAVVLRVPDGCKAGAAAPGRPDSFSYRDSLRPASLAFRSPGTRQHSLETH
jgi:hypothetical protein